MSVNKDIPKSRITITYDMEVNGTKKKKELPFKQLLIGDLSLGNSEEKKQELPNRQIYELSNPNLANVMKPMGIKLKVDVPNHINVDVGEICVDLKVDSMKSFDPNYIAEQIPELAAMLQAKKLINEFDALVDNNRKLRNLLNGGLNSPEALEQIQTELPTLEEYKFNNKTS